MATLRASADYICRFIVALMTGLGPVTVFWLSAVLLVSDGGRLPPHSGRVKDGREY